jgi:hypothetical protein
MKQWSAMLENELRSWPHVATRPMFGLLGFYRKKMIGWVVSAKRAETRRKRLSTLIGESKANRRI